MNFNTMALPLFTAGLTVLAIVLIFYAIFSRPKTIITVTGEPRFEPSDLEKIFSPLFGTLVRRRVGGRAQLARELLWTRSRLKPEAFMLLPFILTPTGFVAAFALGYFALAFDFATSIGFGFGGAIMGWVFLRSRHNSAMRKRQNIIRDDAIDLMGNYASVSVATDDPTTIFSEIDKQTQEEHARAKARFLTSGKNKAMRGPYDGDVYIGLHNMIIGSDQGLVLEGADVDSPDLLQSYAIYCNDDDMTAFLMQLRQTIIQKRTIEADQLEQQVRDLRELRVDQIRSWEATQAIKAMVYLVFFNLLILFTVLMLPFIFPFITPWLHQQFGI